MHSLIILYAQNGERFQMQRPGRVNSGTELFAHIGDIDVRFERLSEPTGVTQARGNAVAVTTSGNRVLVSGNGRLTTTLYDTAGKVLDKATGRDHAALDSRDFSGLAIVEVTDGQQNRSRQKIMIKN